MSGQRIIEAVSRAYGWVPRSWRRRLMPRAETAFAALRRVVLIISQLRLRVHVLRGIERAGGRAMTVAVLGSRRSWPYLAKALFSRLDEARESGGVFIWRASRYPASPEMKPDIVILHADEIFRGLFQGRDMAVLPEWVSFRFDLSRPPEETWAAVHNKNLRENLRRVRKHGYGYEMTTDPARLDSFYREMYLPFIPRRFGESTEPVGPRFMRLFFDAGALLLVKKEGEAVAGSVIMTGRRGAKAMIIGVKGGSEDLIRKGALAACYFFTTLWAREKGFASVNFGECRPFFGDGLFYFKKSWGARLEPYRHRSNVFGMRVVSSAPAALDFLEANPFIVRRGKGLEGRALAGSAGSLSSEELKRILRNCLVPGLDRLVVVSPNGFDTQAEDLVSSSFADRVRLIGGPADTLFSDRIRVAREATAGSAPKVEYS